MDGYNDELPYQDESDEEFKADLFETWRGSMDPEKIVDPEMRAEYLAWLEENPEEE